MSRDKLLSEAKKLGYKVSEDKVIFKVGDFTIDESGADVLVYEKDKKVYSTYSPVSAYTYVYGLITAP